MEVITVQEIHTMGIEARVIYMGDHLRLLQTVLQILMILELRKVHNKTTPQVNI